MSWNVIDYLATIYQPIVMWYLVVESQCSLGNLYFLVQLPVWIFHTSLNFWLYFHKRSYFKPSLEHLWVLKSVFNVCIHTTGNKVSERAYLLKSTSEIPLPSILIAKWLVEPPYPTNPTNVMKCHRFCHHFWPTNQHLPMTSF